MAEILAFTAEHVCRLTKLSARQLGYWDATDFFSPELLDTRRRAFSRIYSFRDVVGLRTISILRNEHNVSLQELRRVGEWLKHHYEVPWSRLRFALAGNRVVFHDPDTGAYVEPRGAGQQVFEITLGVIAEDMHKAASALRVRTPDQIGQIMRNRYLVHNAWVVAGTRIPTIAIWNFYQAGYSTDQIIREYPRLVPEDIEAAVSHERARRRAA
jgi:DNA-binding transcriptional MerR regulator